MDMSDIYKILIAQNPVQDYLTKNAMLQYAMGNPSVSMAPPIYDVTARQRQNLYNKMDESGGKGGQGPSMGAYGTMTSAERQSLSDVSRAMGLGAMLGGPLGMGLGVMGKTISGILGIDDLTNMLGLGSRGFYGLSPQDIQSLNDTYGFGSSQLGSAQTASAIGNSLADRMAVNDPERSLRSMLGSLLGRPEDHTFSAMEAARMDLENTLAEQGYGSWGKEQTPAGMPSNWGEPGMWGGWNGGWGDVSPGVSSAPDSMSSGFGTSDTAGPSTFAQGGVGVFNQPSRPLVGEAGPEMGIFIKPEMFQPGIQGNEQQVKLALFMAAMGLGGRNAGR